ncbi:hypothetical protein D3C80_1675330 [compost metagenome]
MKIRNQRVYNRKLIAGINKNIRPAVACLKDSIPRLSSGRFERPAGGRANGDNPPAP